MMRTRHDLFDRYLRPLKDRALAPLSRLAGPGSPNVITGVGFVLGLGSAGAACVRGEDHGLMLWLEPAALTVSTAPRPARMAARRRSAAISISCSTSSCRNAHWLVTEPAPRDPRRSALC